MGVLVLLPFSFFLDGKCTFCLPGLFFFHSRGFH